MIIGGIGIRTEEIPNWELQNLIKRKKWTQINHNPVQEYRHSHIRITGYKYETDKAVPLIIGAELERLAINFSRSEFFIDIYMDLDKKSSSEYIRFNFLEILDNSWYAINKSGTQDIRKPIILNVQPIGMKASEKDDNKYYEYDPNLYIYCGENGWSFTFPMKVFKHINFSPQSQSLS